MKISSVIHTFMIKDVYHENFCLFFDMLSAVVNQGPETLLEESKIMIGVFCMSMKNMAQTIEKISFFSVFMA